MKQHVLSSSITISLLFLLSYSLSAQTIHVVRNPDQPDLFGYSQNGPLSGYAGNAVILNNSLALQYQPSSSTFSSPSSYVLDCATYIGGDTLHKTANPTNGLGSYYGGPQIVFNNKLFYIYLNASKTQQLASFDGTTVTLYPNPDNSNVGYVGSPRIFNNSLYVAYVNAAGSTQFGKFTGTGIALIANPDGSTTGFFNDYSVVFNNKICSRYVNAAGIKQLATFDGTSWTLLPNPDNTTGGVVASFPVAYKNKLYLQYLSATNQYQLLQYDGANGLTVIPNPVDASSNNGGYAGLPIVFNDTLFFQYYNTSNALQIAKFGGTSVSLVPNPDNTTYGFWNTPVVYNNNLYIFYLTPDGIHHLAQYQGSSNSLKVYPNPDAGTGYWDLPIVFDNNLYFKYYNAQGSFQLGYFNGTSLQLIANPGGYYNGSAGNNGYLGSPVIFNNLLYMQFGGIVTGNVGSLCYIDGSVLPVSLLGFAASIQGKGTLLTWQTANETDNDYFSVERSSDGVAFTAIGKVGGHGSATSGQKYQFVDKVPLKGTNYYRLRQVDITGRATYSAIAKVSFSAAGNELKVYPNPAHNTIILSLPAAQDNSVITLFDMNGKRILQKQISANATIQKLDISMLTAGKYQLQWIQKDGTTQTAEVMKQ